MRSQGVIANIVRRTDEGVELLYMKRSGGRFAGQWWPVAGTLEEDEAPLVALFREIQEETGLSPVKIYELGMEIAHLDTGTPLHSFVVYVSSKCEVNLNHEHSEYAWLNVEDVYGLLHESAHCVIQHIEASFVKREPLPSALVWCA